MKRFYIDPSQISFPLCRIVGSEANHLKNTMRLKENDTVGFFDGTGIEYVGKIKNFSGGQVVVEITEKRLSRLESPIRITLCQGYLKDKKMDDLIRPLTELGIYRWVPFFCERSVPRPDKKRLSNRSARWEKIMIEALKQSERSRKMLIHEAVSFSEAIKMAKEADVRIMFWERGTFPLKDIRQSARHNDPANLFLVLGPEGGFTDMEASEAEKEGFALATLGPRILRAETATVAAATLAQFLFGDLG